MRPLDGLSTRALNPLAGLAPAAPLAWSFGHADIDVFDGDLASIWKFDPANSFQDSVGSNNLINVGTTDIAGVSGRGRNGDGIDDYLDANGATGDFDFDKGSLMLWYQVDNAGIWSDGINRYLAHIYKDGNNQILLYKSSANRLYYRYEANNVIKVRQYNVSARVDTDWHNLIIGWDTSADEITIFEDGAMPLGALGGLGAWVGTPTQFSVMGNRAGGNGWPGKTDEIAFYAGAALDLAAAQAVWNGGVGRFYMLR